MNPPAIVEIKSNLFVPAMLYLDLVLEMSCKLSVHVKYHIIL